MAALLWALCGRAAGPTVRTLEDSSCCTKLFWKQRGQSISHRVSVPLSHHVTLTRSLSQLLSFLILDAFCLLHCAHSHTASSSSLLCQLLSTLRHPVTSLSLSLSPVLFPTLMLSLARPSSITPLIAFIPPHHPPPSSRLHHFSYFEALLLDLI